MYQLHGLNGLRGLAALMVLLSHLSNKELFTIGPYSLAGAGKIGVWLFFSLSAFLLWMNTSERKYSNELDGRYIYNYGTTRFFRIFIPFSLLCIIALVNYMLGGSKIFYYFAPAEFLSNITLSRGSGVLWSVVVEVKFYLLLPLVYLIMRKVDSCAVAISILVGIMIYSRSLSPMDDYTSNSSNLGYYLPIFLAGIASYYLYKSKINNRTLQLLSYISLAFIIITIPGIWGEIFSSGRNYWVKSLDAYAIVCAILIAWIARNGFKLIFFSYPLTWVGKYSFGLYLLHPIGIRVSEKYFLNYSAPMALLAAIGFSLILGWLFFYTIERPSINLGKKLLSTSKFQDDDKGAVGSSVLNAK